MLRKDVCFHKPGRPVTQDDIDQVTTALGGMTLPETYQRYLLRFNGAHPLVSEDLSKAQMLRVWWPVDTFADSTDHVALLGDMYDVQGRPERESDLLKTHQVIGHLLPPGTLAFAAGAGGSVFLLDLRPRRFGEVLFWRYGDIGDHATWAANPFHNVGWVASDFIDFINRIEIEPHDWNAWEAALPPDADLGWRPR